jgi:predicted DNA-binding transcriptional regulator AlpA
MTAVTHLPVDRVSEDDLLTTAEVAAVTRAPASTVRYWRHIGQGPASFRLGRRVVYRRGEVARWLREMEHAD